MKNSNILLLLSSSAFFGNLVFMSRQDGLPLIYIGTACLIGCLICKTIEESNK